MDRFPLSVNIYNLHTYVGFLLSLHWQFDVVVVDLGTVCCNLLCQSHSRDWIALMVFFHCVIRLLSCLIRFFCFSSLFIFWIWNVE